ncbi:MAG: ABC transporter permease [Candidatus Hodarchaeales archaeon]|jgi:ABC-type lipoprotein release transport system permease subunit
MTYSITFTLRLIGRDEKHSINTVIGFALIIALIIGSSGIITGFSKTIFGLTDQVGQSNRFAMKPNDAGNKINNEVLQVLIENSHKIGQILPLAKRRANFSSEGRTLETDLVGTNFTILESLFPDSVLTEGVFPNESNVPFECLEGSELRGFLGKQKPMYIQIENRLINSTIVGSMSGIGELQQVVLVEFTSFCNILNISYEELIYTEIKIRTDNLMNVDSLINLINDILQENGFESHDEYQIWNEQQAEEFSLSFINEIYNKLEIFFAVLFVIALIRLFHSISWFVIHYERSLLIMRSMGMTRKRLFSMMLLLGQVVGNIGFIFGITLGYGVPPIVISLMTNFLDVNFLVTEFPIEYVLGIWIIALLIITAATIIPSAKISNTPPSKISMLVKER